MNKKIGGLLVILVMVVIILSTTRPFVTSKPFVNRDFSRGLPQLTPPVLDLTPNVSTNLARDAWTTFQNYLGFAKVHNLVGVRSLSHQISAVCNDITREKECFALMDNVYLLGIPLKVEDFQNIYSDERQIIMHTNGPTVVILYFTREGNIIKLLGMQFCLEDETAKVSCVNASSIKNDQNNNGWWDSVESLFYSTKI